VVVIADGIIESVAATGVAPDDADLVDLAGATLLPGLIDPHVHLVFDASSTPVDNLAGRTDEEVVEAARLAARTALLGGITTVRDLGDRDYLTVSLRNDPELPTMLVAGPPVTTLTGHCHFLGGGVADTPAAVRTAVLEHAERGVDVIKIMSSGGTLTPGTFQELAQFTPEVLRAAVDEAHRCGLAITAHAHGTQAIRDCLAAGVDGMEHVTFWSAEGVDEPGSLADLIVRQGVVVGATVGVLPVPGSAPPPVIAQRMPKLVANMRLLRSAGARLVAGSDAGISPMKPPDALRHAFPQMREVGMDAAEAMRTVTSVAAEALGLGGSKGRVRAGMDADLLAVNGDPLADLEAIHRIEAVFSRGIRVR
jgi:imidazolonepropionase-like amidohydrolase